MTSGALARAAGVGWQTIRFYHRRGLLPDPPRSRAGRRQYVDADLQRVRFIRDAQHLGFTLEEIQGLLDMRVGPGTNCRSVAAKADEVLERIDHRMKALGAMRRTLMELRVACDTATPTGDCPILKAVEETSHDTPG